MQRVNEKSFVGAYKQKKKFWPYICSFFMRLPWVTPKIDRVPNIHRVAIRKYFKKIMYEIECIKILVLFWKFPHHLSAVEEQIAKVTPRKNS